MTIVADISPVTVDNEGGFATMNTILLADPDIDVVLGADTVVLGALAAVRAAGKDRPDQFFGGIDGEPEAVAELRKTGSPYKTSISLASPVFGYAMGQHAADWLEGKSIPQAMDILPIALNCGKSGEIRIRRGRSRRCVCRPGASCGVPEDVWKHLLRFSRPLPELSVVVRTSIAAGRHQESLGGALTPDVSARISAATSLRSLLSW